MIFIYEKNTDASGDWSEETEESDFENILGASPDTIQFEMAMAEALGTLNHQNQMIATMVASGYNASEIAEEAGVSRKTIYNRINGVIKDAVVEYYC